MIYFSHYSSSTSKIDVLKLTKDHDENAMVILDATPYFLIRRPDTADPLMLIMYPKT